MTTRGDVLRLARQFRGFTQKQTAEGIGVPQAIYSRMENDLAEINVDAVKAASAFLEMPVEFFNLTDTVYGPPVSVHAMFRGKKSEITAKNIDMVTAELNIRLIGLSRFLEIVDINPTLRIPKMDVEEYETPEKVAALLRAHWKIASGPVKNLTSILETAGIIVAFSEFGGTSISGVTFSVQGRPPLILLNHAHPSDRLRFTLAHELGHIIMHSFPTPDMENEANKFASAFLLPPSEMKGVFTGRKITLQLLASLKKEWRVSIQSLLVAANSAGFLSKSQYRYLWQQISAKGWRTREPVSLDFPVEQPVVLPSIFKAYEQLGFSINEIKKITRLNHKDFERLYGFYSERDVTKPTLRMVR